MRPEPADGPGRLTTIMASGVRAAQGCGMKTIGLYRETDGWGTTESARVRYPDGSELDIQRHEYESEGHEPPFEELCTKVEFEAHHG